MRLRGPRSTERPEPCSLVMPVSHSGIGLPDGALKAGKISCLAAAAALTGSGLRFSSMLYLSDLSDLTCRTGTSTIMATWDRKPNATPEAVLPRGRPAVISTT